jgi:hypothetical protein
MSAYRRNGGVWLVVMLPDGFPAPVRVGDTDLGGPCPAAARRSSSASRSAQTMIWCTRVGESPAVAG